MRGRRPRVARYVEAHRHVRERRQVQVDGVADQDLSGIDGRGGFAGEGQSTVRGGDDRAAPIVNRDVRRADRQGRRAECVAETDT